jgi:hypothetical protein
MYLRRKRRHRDEEVFHMDATEPKTLDLETEDVTPRSWEELVKDLVDSDPTPDLYVGSEGGSSANSSCSCYSMYTSTTCDS